MSISEYFCEYQGGKGDAKGREGMFQFKSLCTIVSRYMHRLYLKLYNTCIYRHTMVLSV